MESFFIFAIKKENISWMLCNTSNFLRWYDTLDRWPFLFSSFTAHAVHIFVNRLC